MTTNALSAGTAPQDLRCDGALHPLALRAAAPTFTWVSPTDAVARQVRVDTEEGTLVWDSGEVAGDEPSLRFGGGRLEDRMRLQWQVRTWDRNGAASDWSAKARFETGLIDPSSWKASWIARAVAPVERAHRAIGDASVVWATPGMVLEQPVPTPPGTTLVAADLLERESRPFFRARMELVSTDGDVLAAVGVVKDGVPLDYFARFLEITEAIPSDGCALRLTVDEGEVGWIVAADSPVQQDDGVSPVVIRDHYRKDGQEQAGVLAVGVEVHPAADPQFMTTFTLREAPVRARLYATGLGYGRFELNDHPVTDATLEPAQTDYDQRVLYAAYDVTDLLQEGENVVSAALGRGFWSVRGGDTWGWHLASWNREPQLIVQLEVSFADGTSMTISSDEAWLTKESAVVSDLLYTGVTYDLSRTSEWEPATKVTAPAGRLQATILPPVRRSAAISPERSWITDGGTEVLDFGRTLAGRVRGRLRSDSGGELTVRYGELVSDAGSVVCANPLAAGETQVDRVRCAGTLTDVEWEPDFSYKGFRYVEISTTGDIAARDVVAVPLHNDVRTVGTFSSDEDTLTWIDGALARTFLNNLHGVPTDTPAYEKNGWTADAHLGVTGAMHHVELRWALAKWMEDHVDAQADAGGIPQIIPTPGWGVKPDPAWSASAVLIPWDLYQEYGDADLLADHLSLMTRYVDYALGRAEAEGWIWRAHGWGDWLAPGHQFPPEGAAPTSTMMLHRTAQRAADACDALGRADEAAAYREAASRLAAAYHREYFDDVSGSYRVAGVGYRQSLNILPLAFGAVPDEHRAAVFASLVGDLENRTGRHLDCGAASVKQLLPVLDAHGRADLALDVLLQTTRPGWHVWRQDSDTLWESWDPDARSRNHYFLGSVAAWIQQRVGGLRASAPGWRSIEFAPITDERVLRARTTHETVRGLAAADWSRSGREWQIDLTVPAGSHATVRIDGTPPLMRDAGIHRIRLETA